MKKIISALTISALTLSSIFADVSLSYKQKGYLSSNEGGKSTKLDLNGYNAKIKGDVVFKLSNENAGVVLDVVPYYKDTGRTDKLNSDTDFFDQYYGWVKFFGGAFKLQSGVWSTRTVNRLTTDAGQWEDPEYEYGKYGVIGGAVAKDITRLASVNGTYKGHLTSAITYTNGGFYATGAIITNDFKTSAGTLGTTTTKSGFGLETGFNLNETTKLQAFLKSTQDQEIAFAVFLDKSKITIFERNLDIVTGVTVGGTFGTTTDSGLSTNGIEAAFDIRARYALTDAVALTTMNNLSYSGFTKNSNGDSGKVSLWDMVSISVKASETLKFQVTGEWVYDDLTKRDSGKLSVIPGIVFAPVAGADITTGIIIKTENWSHPTKSSIAIPFILRVAL